MKITLITGRVSLGNCGQWMDGDLIDWWQIGWTERRYLSELICRPTQEKELMSLDHCIQVWFSKKKKVISRAPQNQLIPNQANLLPIRPKKTSNCESDP